MLVDLSRNDLVKVCAPTSVEVVDFMAVNRYSHIMHICSTVVGRLEAPDSALDAFIATFPAGTLSGAPKPRAIALIDEVEPARRGFYGGAVGYFDFAGNMDVAIAIRTALIKDGVAHVQAGAGIVADSVPAREAQETRDKAAAMIRAISLATLLRSHLLARLALTTEGGNMSVPTSNGADLPDVAPSNHGRTLAAWVTNSDYRPRRGHRRHRFHRFRSLDLGLGRRGSSCRRLWLVRRCGRSVTGNRLRSSAHSAAFTSSKEKSDD